MLSRRHFLIGAATVLAASATGCRLRVPTPALEPAKSPQAAEPGGERPFRIALLSDTHCQELSPLVSAPGNAKLMRAVADFKSFKPDLWLCNGDVSDDGLPGQHEAFKRILSAVAKPDQIMVTTGNHEFYDKGTPDDVALTRFREAFGLKRAYNNRVVSGIHMVMLADEQWKTAPKNPDWAWLTPEQLNWFEQVLQEQRDKFTVVCLHQPLQETVLGSQGNNNFGGCGQVAELRAILKKNPQVKLWFSGHTHQLIELQGQSLKQGEVTFAALGSTFYLFDSSGSTKNFDASESRMLEVWPDRVVLRSRNHANQAWFDGQDLTLRRA
jgi:3',5'-cyclic AMP phosphodiesterase CpdA